MLSVKQGGIKYNLKKNFFFFFVFDTWDWIRVYQTIGKYSTHYVVL